MPVYLCIFFTRDVPMPGNVVKRLRLQPHPVIVVIRIILIDLIVIVDIRWVGDTPLLLYYRTYAALTATLLLFAVVGR